MNQQEILTAINTAMVINKKVSKIKKFAILRFTFFLLKFVGTVFVGIAFALTFFILL